MIHNVTYNQTIFFSSNKICLKLSNWKPKIWLKFSLSNVLQFSRNRFFFQLNFQWKNVWKPLRKIFHFIHSCHWVLSLVPNKKCERHLARLDKKKKKNKYEMIRQRSNVENNIGDRYFIFREVHASNCLLFHEYFKTFANCICPPESDLFITKSIAKKRPLKNIWQRLFRHQSSSIMIMSKIVHPLDRMMSLSWLWKFILID